jgi:hypothetical protein
MTQMARIAGDFSAFIRVIRAICGQKFCGLKSAMNSPSIHSVGYSAFGVFRVFRGLLLLP